MELNERLRSEILEMVSLRGIDKTICPSEVARKIGASEEVEWRDLMGPVKEVTLQLVSEGEVVIKQKGAVVDAKDFKGPYRIALSGEKKSNEFEWG